jgi:hypothetical protein
VRDNEMIDAGYTRFFDKVPLGMKAVFTSNPVTLQSIAMPNHRPNHHSNSIALTEASPCDGCNQQKSCAELRLACEAYASYENGFGRGVWSRASRKPRAAIYAALFKHDDGGGEIEASFSNFP